MSGAATATKEMCFFCFETLENAVTKGNTHVVSEKVVRPDDPTECALFVTYKVTKDDSLRGCIGCFDPLKLWKGLAEYAVIAGMHDHRFSPIAKPELPGLTVAVSLLHSFEDCADAFDWEVGKHGIRLFVDGHRSTFLPEVAAERAWSKQETLQYLARKGGFAGKFDAAAAARAKVVRYQSSKISATWEEYQNFVKGL